METNKATIKDVKNQVKGRLEALHPQYFVDEATWKHDVKGTLSIIEDLCNIIADQSKREERERINKLLDSFQRDESKPWSAKDITIVEFAKAIQKNLNIN